METNIYLLIAAYLGLSLYFAIRTQDVINSFDNVTSDIIKIILSMINGLLFPLIIYRHIKNLFKVTVRYYKMLKIMKSICKDFEEIYGLKISISQLDQFLATEQGKELFNSINLEIDKKG